MYKYKEGADGHFECINIVLKRTQIFARWNYRTCTAHMRRFGQNRIYTTYMTVFLVISLPKMPHIHRIYIYMVLANPTHTVLASPTRETCSCCSGKR